jgi:glycosyltransferase involved in cell wall biosynthesis
VRRRLEPESEPHPYDVERLRSVAVPGAVGYPLLAALPSRLMRRADVVHAHAANYVTVDVPLALRPADRWALVVSPYLSPRQGLKWRIHRAWLRRAIRRADAVVVISEFERRILLAAGLRGPDPLVVAPSVTAPDAAPRRPADPPIVLSVGRVEAGKGLDVLIRAWPAVLRAVPEAHLVIAGPDQGARAPIERLAGEQGIGHAVRLTGRLSAAQLDEAYRQASVLAFPTRYETFGVVLLEAMARGVPIVAAAAAAVPEVAGDAALLHLPDDPVDLARRLVQVLLDDALQEELAQAGRARAVSVYPPAAQIDKLEEIYSAVSARRRRGG